MAKTRRKKREIKKLIDEILNDFQSSEDEGVREYCLKQIQRIMEEGEYHVHTEGEYWTRWHIKKEHFLNRKQLDRLTCNLDKEDIKILGGRNRILGILLDNVERGTLPKKKSEFVRKLKTLLEKYREPNEENAESDMYYYLMSLLGKCQEKIVKKYLIMDIMENRINKEMVSQRGAEKNSTEAYFVKTYFPYEGGTRINSYLSEILKKHETELYKFGKKLIEEGEKEKAEMLSMVINNIRPSRYAIEKEEEDKNPFVNFIVKIARAIKLRVGPLEISHSEKDRK